MLEDSRIPVSWWIFFADGEPAASCARELECLDFLTLVEHRPDIIHRSERWLVRAARPFLPGSFQEERRLVSEIVRAHGGVNEGSDSGWLFEADDLVRFHDATAG